jgi:4-amino-4-deoxy-L-arabinose transferase-like glycosyltransferase
MRRYDIRLLAILITALIARLAFLVFFGGFDNQLHDSMADQTIYIDIAQNLADGKGFVLSTPTWVADAGMPTAIVPPLYPIFLALIFRIFGASLLAVRWITIFLSLWVVWVAYDLGGKLFNPTVGTLAGLITALYPALVMYVRPIMSEGIFFPLIALLVWLTERLTRSAEQLTRKGARWYQAALWGLTAGLSILTRTESIILAGLLFLYIIFMQRKQKSFSWLFSLAAPIGLAGLVLLPAAVYNFTTQGNFTPLPNAKWKMWDHTYWAGMSARPENQGKHFPEQALVPNWSTSTETERDAYLWGMALNFIESNPKIFISQRFEQLLWSYPLLPLEEIPPPFGNKGASLLPDGRNYGPTSLDDVVRYITPAEKLRVWFFRLTFLLMLVGMVWMVWKKRAGAYWLALVLFYSVFHSMFLVGSERMRLQIEPTLILVASYGIYELFHLRGRALLSSEAVGADGLRPSSSTQQELNLCPPGYNTSSHK